MRKRLCTCGAEADVRRGTRRAANDGDEIVYRMICSVCGQLGPAIPAAGMDEATAVAAAVAAWNEMIARVRPLEDGFRSPRRRVLRAALTAKLATRRGQSRKRGWKEEK